MMSHLIIIIIIIIIITIITIIIYLLITRRYQYTFSPAQTSFDQV